MSVVIVFETHSMSVDNEHGIATGWLDGRLSSTGKRLALDLGARRRDDHLAAVFSSDLGRAVETAEVAFEGTSIPIYRDLRLRECDYGELNGMPVSRLESERLQHVDEPYPGGESYRQVTERVRAFLRWLLREWDGTRVLVIGHSATRWALEHLLVGIPLEKLVNAPFAWQEGWLYSLETAASGPVHSLPDMTPGSDKQALELIDFWTPFVLRMCVDAGVMTAFGREDRSAQEVAATTGMHGESLARVLRVLASRGVFEAAGDDRYRLTEVGRTFLPDVPGSVAGIAGYRPWELHAWAEAGHTLRTGEPSFPLYFRQGVWDWLAENPELSTKFNDDMRRRTTSLLARGLPLYDWPESGTIVDVGGGSGLLLERLLDLKPGLHGVAFDLPHVIAEADEHFRAAGLDERVEAVGGDFFAEIPAGHDVYVLASVLHDWDDDQAVRILENCRRSMLPSSRLVLFEWVLQPGNEFDFSKMLDLHMLVLFGAKERTREEWERLLGRAGFALKKVVPTPGLSWIESKPAR